MNGYNDRAISSESPDEISFEKIVNILKNTASFSHEKSLPTYITGPISSVVYAVEGGMEDWGYAAGWENDAEHELNDEGKIEKDMLLYPIIDKCKPFEYGGKPFKSDSRKD